MHRSPATRWEVGHSDGGGEGLATAIEGYQNHNDNSIRYECNLMSDR